MFHIRSILGRFHVFGPKIISGPLSLAAGKSVHSGGGTQGVTPGGGTQGVTPGGGTQEVTPGGGTKGVLPSGGTQRVPPVGEPKVSPTVGEHPVLPPVEEYLGRVISGITTAATSACELDPPHHGEVDSVGWLLL